MTTNERRAAWRQYALADLRSAGTSPSAIGNADRLLAAEDERFGKPDDELRLARAHALEQETRAANAEMALRQAQHVIRVLKEDEAPSVHVCDAAEQRAAAAKPAEGGGTGGAT